MEEDELENVTDLTQKNLDPELFAAAHAVQYISKLLAFGGNLYSRPDDEEALHPEHLEHFVSRALENARRTRRFSDHWSNLQQALPYIKTAWVKGGKLFQEDLMHATNNQGQMNYFSQIDFAVDCYAYISAKNTYPDNSMMQAWAINGYMTMWRDYFLRDL